MGGPVSACCNALITRKNARTCPECGGLLNKPERCEERVVLTFMVSNPLMEMKAEFRDARQCYLKKGHKPKHKFKVGAERLGKPIDLEVLWTT